MFRFSLPLGLALASACLLPYSASAIPINAADGVADAPAAASGARRPGLIPKPAADAGIGSGTQTSNGRGRPVPGKISNDAMDKTMAEIDPSQVRP